MKATLKCMIEASLVAGREILEIYKRDFEVEYKDDESPLTEADTKANEVITSFLEPFDEIKLLSEESCVSSYEDRKSWKKIWVVDPIDGTKEFIKKNGQFTVNIAYVEDSKPVAGVVYAPDMQLLYVGMVDFGARLIQEIDCRKKIEIPEDLFSWGLSLPLAKQNRPYRVVASKSHRNMDTEDLINRLRERHPDLELSSFGSSLKLCKVADGSADIYPRIAPTMEWDTAAAHAVVNAAGMEVFHASTGEPLKYNKENLLNPHFIVAPTIDVSLLV